LEGLDELELGEEICMHAAPTKNELENHGLEPKTELENHQNSGMVDVTGDKGRKMSDHRGIEQRYMERGWFVFEQRQTSTWSWAVEKPLYIIRQHFDVYKF
jgi:hypothetical protein